MPKGVRITTLQRLDVLRQLRCSVIVPGFLGFAKPKPAAFIMEMPGTIILRMFNTGMYMYRPAYQRKAENET